jgi:NAD(P)-dependent dehydrogenase (short-subunit alcohol dehydrogenase family)
MTPLSKVVFVTGGATRVGKAIALGFAERGVNVAFTYLNDDECWEETVQQIRETGVKALAISMDVREPSQPSKAIERAIDYFGSIDILVNNASVWLSKPFLEIDLSDWQNVLAVNLTGPFLCSQAAAPHMLKRQTGCIINILDLSAFQTWPDSSHHAASKAGLLALTRVMALELAPYVRVNAVAPGSVLLPVGASEEKARWAINNSLVKRVGRPEDVAKTVIFLSESDFVTGSVYFVDGGRALMSPVGLL